VWAWTAARHFGIAGVATWSGGTEVTSFAPGAVAALVRAGFRIEPESGGDNPVQRVHGLGGAMLRCWSKRCTDAAIPRTGLVAIMTCAAADAACPTVPGAVLRVPLVHDDPKLADGTPGEAAAYDERCAAIARELLYLFGALAASSE
jgi:arsenate reductase